MKKGLFLVLMFVIPLTFMIAGGGNQAASQQSGQSTGPVPIPLAQRITLNAMVRCDDNTSVEWDKMAFWEKIERETNVRVNWDITKGADDFLSKMNVMFVSGSYPDIITGGIPQAQQTVELYGVQQGIIIKLDDYLYNNHLPNYFNLLKDRPSALAQHKATDGHIYALGYLFDAGIPQFGVLIMNHKLLKDNGIAVPDPDKITFAQFEQTLRALRATGKREIIPLSMRFDDQYTGMSSLAGLWGTLAVNGMYHTPDNNGKVYNTATTPQFRQYLEWLSAAYRDGLVDYEMIGQDASTHNAKAQSRNVGFWISHRLTGSGTSFDGIENECVVVVPPARDGVRPVWRHTPDAQINLTSAFITTANKNIPQTMAWLNYLHDPMISMQSRFGLLGQFTEISPEGKLRQSSTINVVDEVNKTVPATSGFYFMFAEQVQALYTLNSAQMETITNQSKYSPYFGKYAPEEMNRSLLSQAETEEINQISLDLKRYMDETIAGFVSNGVTDAGWNAYLNMLRTLRNERYIQLLQKRFDNYIGQ